jgi:hypothetical protein
MNFSQIAILSSFCCKEVDIVIGKKKNGLFCRNSAVFLLLLKCRISGAYRKNQKDAIHPQRNRNRPAHLRTKLPNGHLLSDTERNRRKMRRNRQLKWDDIDFESKVINITPEKGSNPRVNPLSNKLIGMLQALPKLRRPSILLRGHAR